MIYEVENGKTKVIENQNSKTEGYYLGILSPEKAFESLSFFQIPPTLFEHVMKNPATRFEARENIDVFCIPTIKITAPTLSDPEVVYFFLTKNSLLVVCTETQNVQEIFQTTTSMDGSFFTSERLISNFFEDITHRDAEYLEKIEQEINILEDQVLLNREHKDAIHKIIYFRKKISLLKRYYEQLLDIFDSLEENENNLLTARALRSFKILDGRIDRLYHSTLNLSDYVSQIREAYQSEVDINLNQTMKIFTVLTAIFFPLTLIVGWYGMNLKMPEYNWAFGYPFVILISVVIIVACFLYFKKHKWF
jgi:Mg2+ and Co2+ transporters